VLSGVVYATGLEGGYVYALGPQSLALKNQGTALQAAASKQPDMLVIYGSSELNIADPYNAGTLFASRPTGFTICLVGKAGTTSLVILQDLAAVGGDLRGKKVVVSLSAPWFFGAMQAADSYAGNYSRLHGGELVWNSRISWVVKRGAAIRMLDYPATLQKDPVLRFAVTKLAQDTLLSRFLYCLTVPIGWARDAVLRIQDHWEVVAYIWKQRKLNPMVPTESAAIDWAALLTKAEKEQAQRADNNPFGFENQIWLQKLRSEVARQANSRTDAAFLSSLAKSKEWTDFELLIRGVKDMGGDVLVLSMPIQGTYYSYTGVSYQARQAYYDRLEAICKKYDVPALDFRDHDMDKYFLIDSGAHLSRKGWIFYDRALDSFYHGTLGE